MIVIKEISEKFERVIVTRVDSQHQSLHVSRYKKHSTFFLIMYCVHTVKNRGVLFSRRRDLWRRNSAKRLLFLGKDKRHGLSWTTRDNMIPQSSHLLLQYYYISINRATKIWPSLLV